MLQLPVHLFALATGFPSVGGGLAAVVGSTTRAGTTLSGVQQWLTDTTGTRIAKLLTFVCRLFHALV